MSDTKRFVILMSAQLHRRIHAHAGSRKAGAFARQALEAALRDKPTVNPDREQGRQ